MATNTSKTSSTSSNSQEAWQYTDRAWENQNSWRNHGFPNYTNEADKQKTPMERWLGEPHKNVSYNAVASYKPMPKPTDNAASGGGARDDDDNWSFKATISTRKPA